MVKIEDQLRRWQHIQLYGPDSQMAAVLNGTVRMMIEVGRQAADKLEKQQAIIDLIGLEANTSLEQGKNNES